MTDQTLAPAPTSDAMPDNAPAPTMDDAISAPADTPERVSLREAGRILNAARAARAQPQETRQAGAEPATPPETSPVDDAAPPQEATGEFEAQATDPATEPPIEPPRSWSAEKKDAFRALPRDTQEYIVEQESARDAAVRRSQNEAAEQRKAADAEKAAATEARKQYEAALPQLLASLQSSGEFADIKTTEDVERLVREDWPRYVQWDFHQKKIAAVQQELQQTQQRQEREAQDDWTNFAKREDELFLEKAPEMKDQAKAAKLRTAAVELLKEHGFSEDELGKLWSGKVLRDHRMQLILLNAVRFKDAQKAALAAAKKPLPPVQRPGTSQPNRGADAQLKDLETRVDNSRGINQLRAAANLVAERRRSAS